MQHLLPAGWFNAQGIYALTCSSASHNSACTNITTHLENVRKEITADVNLLRSDMFQKIDTMRGELFVVKTAVANAKVWTLSLQITIAASLLAVMAHGFKWL